MNIKALELPEVAPPPVYTGFVCEYPNASVDERGLKITNFKIGLLTLNLIHMHGLGQSYLLSFFQLTDYIGFINLICFLHGIRSRSHYDRLQLELT